ncbi:hypothetical protein C4553_02250 [Candidatus Parcubacteria bacterium]|nr:MAG: hypothetical protein C4553_02250 [Candidatus Parcubacteria bacterium]
MKFSYNWLKELSGSKASSHKMAELLTLHSFEAKVSEKKGKDEILEIDILPNRSHEGFSHWGVARELEVLTNSKSKNSQLKFKESNRFNAKDFVSVKIQNPEGCPRYSAAMIDNVKVGPSPKWLKDRLENLGLNSVNNIVDITNYVMLEMGQPLHAFDADRIALDGNKPTIVIRNSKQGEIITTLDGIKRELPAGVLLISDVKKPLAIGGIKGGAGSEIKEKTKTIIIEAANFNSNLIRKEEKMLGLKTDASLRFGQGLSPDLTDKALKRAVCLIQKVAGGEAYKDFVDVYPKKLQPFRILFDVAKVEKFSGLGISKEEISKLLIKLGFEVYNINPYANIQTLVELAKKLVGSKYKYGASTMFDAPFIFDCSSLVRYLFRQIGIEVPPTPPNVAVRRTLEQAEMGKIVKIKDIEPGDLVFAKGSKPAFNEKFPKGIGHVGLYIGNGEVVHAAGEKINKVVRESLKSFLRRYQLRLVKRIIDKDMDKEFLLVISPTTRTDVSADVDLVEEIVRVKGYNNLKAQIPKHWLFSPEINENFSWQTLFGDILTGIGFDEVYNYAFIGSSEANTFFGGNSLNPIVLANPLSAQHSHLRPTLLVGLLKNAKDNLRFYDNFRIFEIGKVYNQKTKTPSLGENLSLAGVYVSQSKKESDGFYELKGFLDTFFEKLGITGLWYDDFEPHPSKASRLFWGQGFSAEIKIGNVGIGFMGKIDKWIVGKFDISKPVFAFEIDMPELLKKIRADYRYQEIPKYPAVERDISLLVPLYTKVDDIQQVIENSGGRLLANSDLIDMYVGDDMAEGKESMTFRLVFQSKERTLRDEEITKIMNKIIKAIKQKDWEVR